MKKVKLNISFEYECDVDADDENEAFERASDMAMDYFESIASDSRKFDEFWEYKVSISRKSIKNTE
jgi:hypothetical protein